MGIPAGLGLALLANELVLALLGAKWISVVPFIQIMGLTNVASAIGASGGYALLALGRTRATTIYTWLHIVLFIALAMLAIPKGGALEIALLRLAISAFGLLIFIWLVKRELPSLRALEILGSVWRPCVASLVMAFALLHFSAFNGFSNIMQLLLKTLLGAAIYSVTLILMWRLVHCPAGAESYLLEKINLYRKPARPAL